MPGAWPLRPLIGAPPQLHVSLIRRICQAYESPSRLLGYNLQPGTLVARLPPSNMHPKSRVQSYHACLAQVPGAPMPAAPPARCRNEYGLMYLEPPFDPALLALNL
eukprot:441198-Pelagomonas_calceolata.AAC.12